MKSCHFKASRDITTNFGTGTLDNIINKWPKVGRLNWHSCMISDNFKKGILLYVYYMGGIDLQSGPSKASYLAPLPAYFLAPLPTFPASQCRIFLAPLPTFRKMAPLPTFFSSSSSRFLKSFLCKVDWIKFQFYSAHCSNGLKWQIKISVLQYTLLS